jgi:hypothetical protein
MGEAAKREGAFELMIRVEESAGAFYKACAGKFPDRRDFWLTLASAEEAHARFLRDLARDPADALAFAYRRRTAVSPLKVLLDFLSRNLAALETTSVTLVHALAIARDIENSVLEKQILEAVPGDSPHVRKTIQRMNAETGEHRTRIEAALAEFR